MSDMQTERRVNRANHSGNGRADGSGERFLTDEQREELLRKHARHMANMERMGERREIESEIGERERPRRLLKGDAKGNTWVRPKKRRKRRRERRLGVLALVLLCIGLLAVGVYFVFMVPRQMGIIQKNSYPMSYVEEIKRHSERYGLDPARVAAVVFCESSYRPEAMSNVGARGLMQIMPETGEWLATKLNDAEYTDDKLFDVETNLSYGCWYLHYLDERFSGDLVLATAAYHTGQGHVDSWLKDEANSQDGVTLDVIPSSVTDTYVNRVLKAYDQYKELYADEAARAAEESGQEQNQTVQS